MHNELNIPIIKVLLKKGSELHFSDIKKSILKLRIINQEILEEMKNDIDFDNKLLLSLNYLNRYGIVKKIKKHCWLINAKKITNKYWTKVQTIIAFNLYCKIPFNRVASNHPDIIKIAKVIGRSPNSVKMKIGNFGSFDPELKKKGIVGLTNTSKLDKEVWDEFNSDWERLAYESEVLIAKFKKQKIEEHIAEFDYEKYSEGEEKESKVKTRIKQSFFRQTILSAYNNTCCITGLTINHC